MFNNINQPPIPVPADAPKQLEPNQIQKLNTPPINQEKDSKKLKILIFIVLLIISFLITPTFFLGADSPGSKLLGLSGEEGLAGAFITSIVGFIAVPVVAFIYTLLAVYGLKGIRSPNILLKLVGLVSLVFILLSIVLPIGSFIRNFQQNKAKEQSTITNLGFKVYEPSSRPSGTIGRNYEKLCDGIKYTYYGSLTTIILTQIKADNTSCGEVNRKDYDEALSFAQSNTTYTKGYNSYRVIIKLVGAENVLILRRINDDGKLWFEHILAIKDDTLIQIDSGNEDCLPDSKCEQKSIDFYNSLQ